MPQSRPFSQVPWWSPWCFGGHPKKWPSPASFRIWCPTLVDSIQGHTAQRRLLTSQVILISN